MSDWLFDEQDVKQEAEPELTDKEIKEIRKKELIDLTRQRKEIDKKIIQTASSLADESKKALMFDSTIDIYRNILENDALIDIELDEIILKSFSNGEDMEEYLKDKSKRWYRSADVFEAHNEHPIQKKLVRGKVVNKMGAKRTTTPLNLLNYLYKEKSGDQRFKAMEERLKNLETLQSTTTSFIEGATKEFVVLKESVESVKHDLSIVMKIVDEVKEELSTNFDIRKIHCYAMYINNIDKSVILKSFGISRSTMFKWVSEVKEVLNNKPE